MESNKNDSTCASTDVTREATSEHKEKSFQRVQHEIEVSVSLYINSNRNVCYEQFSFLVLI